MAGAHEAPKKVKRAVPAASAGRTGPDKAPARRTAPGKGPNRRGRVAVIAALCAVGALLLGCGLFVLRVHSLDTVFPNIRLDGIEVGGLTRDEALATLRRDAPEGYAGKSVTVELPDGQSLTVLAQDIGLGGTQEAAVDAACDYGRDGSAVENAVTYLRCRWGAGVNILWQGAGLDRAALDALAEEAAEAANRTLQDQNAKGENGRIAKTKILDDRIEVTKSSDAPFVDSAELARLIETSFVTREYSTVVYTPQYEDGGDLQSLYDEVYAAPENAAYDKTTQSVTKETPGVRFDLARAQNELNAAAAGDTVTIELLITQPEITADALRENMFRDVLAEKTLALEDEEADVTAALARAVDGTVLLPGEEFSLLSCADAVAGDDFDRFASALYGCAMQADLTITERRGHETPMDGWPLGMDAKVRRDEADLRFANGQDWPVRIDAWTENGSLYLQLWGTNTDGSYITITANGWEDAAGYRVQTQRNHYAADGTLLASEPEAYSRYNQ